MRIFQYFFQPFMMQPNKSYVAPFIEVFDRKAGLFSFCFSAPFSAKLLTTAFAAFSFFFSNVGEAITDSVLSLGVTGQESSVILSEKN